MVELGSRSAGELRSIQYLRAIAALMVVAFHIEVTLVKMGWQGQLTQFLAGGVDIFFVISGFIMWLTTARAQTTPAQFYHRRIVRIVPLYWIVTTFIVLVSLVAPRLMQSSRFDAAHVTASYLFVAWPHPVLTELFPVIGPGWTLNYEMFFYLVFGAALLLQPGRRLWFTGGVLGALVALGVVFKPSGIGGFYTSSLMLEFLFGMIIGWAYCRWRFASTPLAWALSAAGALGLIAFGSGAAVPATLRFLLYGLPASAIVSGAVMLETAEGLVENDFGLLLGAASYAIYLTHGVLVSALMQVVRRILPGPAGQAVFAVAAMSAAISFGVAVHLGIERPVSAWLRKHTGRPRRLETQPSSS